MKTPISHVQLELAMEPDHPFGDAQQVYHLYVPLNGAGQIDLEEFGRQGDKCRVRRRRPGEHEAEGRIVRDADGRWVFAYRDKTSGEAELTFGEPEERLAPGEVVSITGQDGRLHSFQVVAVRRE